ncbi:MAG: arylsulfatase [Planctomycetota bacterium]|jgi:arylsulfatase A-like enzyme
MGTQTRREFLKTMGLAAASVPALSILPGCADKDEEVQAEQQQPPGKKPNIIFIMADDLGYAHLGCYGQKIIKTPHIDQLAVDGMKFTQVYSGCTVCAPCRSVLMTGQHMGHTSVRKNSGGVSLLAEDVTVAEVLKKAGYTTGGYGKWGVGDAGTDGMATKQGFDEFFGYYHQVHAHYYYPEYLWHNDKKVPLAGNENDGRKQYAHDLIMQRALDFIRTNKDRPFFCYMPITIPHTELLVPDEAMRKYTGRFPEPNPWVDKRRHYADQPRPRTAFAAMVTHLDHGIGQVMALLKKLEIDDNTIVFFTSDNGGQGSGGPDAKFFEANKPLRGYKGHMYEGGIRVPMIVRWPGKVKAGAISDHISYFPDMMPTFAELAGTAATSETDGISIVPTLIGAGKQQEHEFLYWELGDEGSIRQAVRMGRWKAVRPKAGAALELYDLETDIGETKNLAEQRSDIMAKIEAYLKTARTPMRPQGEPEGVEWDWRNPMY